jgi:hypothetical protein
LTCIKANLRLGKFLPYSRLDISQYRGASLTQHAGMVKLFHYPASAALEALAREGAARLGSIDPRLESLRLSVEGGEPRANGKGVVAHLEILLPEHQVILNRRHPHDTALAVRATLDAAAISLQEIARRDALRPGLVI